MLLIGLSEVTERHRTSSISSRLFPDMVEITDLITHNGMLKHSQFLPTHTYDSGQVIEGIEARWVKSGNG